MTFFGAGVNGVDVRPHCLHGAALHFVQITLQSAIPPRLVKCNLPSESSRFMVSAGTRQRDDAPLYSYS